MGLMWSNVSNLGDLRVQGHSFSGLVQSSLNSSFVRLGFCVGDGKRARSDDD